MTDQQHSGDSKLEQAYHTMMQRVQAALQDAESGIDTVAEALKHAGEKAVELGELTGDEAEKVADWVRRDAHEAGDYLASTGRDMRDWLHMDMELIELKLLDLMTSVADQTKLELLNLEERAKHVGEYHSGEIAGPGTLECKECGELLHFAKAGHIPPCPKCRHTVFTRKSA